MAMDWGKVKQRIGRSDPRVAVTWLGAVVVLACGAWLSQRGGVVGFSLRNPLAAERSSELVDDLEPLDRRLALERASRTGDRPLRECRLASLHWDRAVRLAQHDFYHQFGLHGADDREGEYAAFRARCLRRDRSGDVTAAMAAARRALRLTHAGSRRVRGLWLLSLTCAAQERREEEIGALIEVTRYRPHQPWIWNQLARAFRAQGDPARLELAEEQAWRATTGRPLSTSISLQLRHTPYARPAPRPEL